MKPGGVTGRFLAIAADIDAFVVVFAVAGAGGLAAVRCRISFELVERTGEAFKLGLVLQEAGRTGLAWFHRLVNLLVLLDWDRLFQRAFDEFKNLAKNVQTTEITTTILKRSGGLVTPNGPIWNYLGQGVLKPASAEKFDNSLARTIAFQAYFAVEKELGSTRKIRRI